MDPETTLTTYASKLQAKLPSFDLSTILGIITGLLGLFGGGGGLGGICPTPPTGATLKETLTNKPVMAGIYINMALRNEGIRPLTMQGRQAHQAVLAVATESAPAELDSFLQFAQSQG
jgi:hypothetical protein